MKKILSLTLTAVMVAGLAACGNSSSTSTTAAETASVAETEAAGAEKPETITITAMNANSEPIEVEVPYDPQRVVVVDMASLDILDNLGLGDRVVGSSTTALEYLQSYVNDENVANLGTIKEADMDVWQSIMTH